MRHKLLVQVLLVQNVNQTLKASARGLWDGNADGWACERYENDNLICLAQVLTLGKLHRRPPLSSPAQVYGLYFE